MWNFIAQAALAYGSARLHNKNQKRAQDRAFNQDQKNYDRNDLIKTMKDAKEAGFHPLEALRAGYTQSQVAQAPRISSVSVAANAVDQISAIYRDEQQRKTNNALIDAQIANIEADTARMGNISQNAVRLASSGAVVASGAPNNSCSDYIDSNDAQTRQIVQTPTGPREIYRGQDLDERVLSWFDETSDALGYIGQQVWQRPKIAIPTLGTYMAEGLEAAFDAPSQIGPWMARLFSPSGASQVSNRDTTPRGRVRP